MGLALDIVFGGFAVLMGVLFLAIGLTIIVRNTDGMARLIGGIVLAMGAGITSGGVVTLL